MIKILILLVLAIKSAHASQLHCATEVLYRELRSGSDKAKLEIVFKPTLNRAADMLLGGIAAEGSKVETKRLDVCAVIKAKGQYQWTKRKKLPVLEKEEWDEAREMAGKILSQHYYIVTARRFFNNASLGRLHQTKASVIQLSGMVAY
ncbi:MAG: hypothetical protein WBI40_03640 [Methylococcaceae bacterium]